MDGAEHVYIMCLEMFDLIKHDVADYCACDITLCDCVCLTFDLCLPQKEDRTELQAILK